MWTFSDITIIAGTFMYTSGFKMWNTVGRGAYGYLASAHLTWLKWPKNRTYTSTHGYSQPHSFTEIQQKCAFQFPPISIPHVLHLDGVCGKLLASAHFEGFWLLYQAVMSHAAKEDICIFPKSTVGLTAQFVPSDTPDSTARTWPSLAWGNVTETDVYRHIAATHYVNHNSDQVQLHLSSFLWNDFRRYTVSV